MTDSSAVTGASLGRLSPIIRPAAMTLLPAARVWADEEWERIKLGYRARSMDEKWNVFVDGNVAFLHRSWTGHAVFEATFSRVDRGWRISAAVAESHPKRAAKVSPQLKPSPA